MGKGGEGEGLGQVDHVAAEGAVLRRQHRPEIIRKNFKSKNIFHFWKSNKINAN